MPNHDYRPDLMGHAVIEPAGPIEAGSWQSLVLTYTAGKFGIDDNGGLRLAFRTHCDMTPLQLTDPTAPGYLSIETPDGVPFEADFSYKRNIRPWGKCVTLLCKRFIKPGDQIVFRIGDKRFGSPGVRCQTHVEAAHQFRITVDAFATSDYTPLPEAEQPTIAIESGAVVKWKAILPTLRHKDDSFRLIVKGEDRWGNPSDKFDGALSLHATGPMSGLPETVRFGIGDFSQVIEGITVDQDGEYKVEVRQGDQLVAVSNPLRVIADTPLRQYWSDMHGQSGETIGSGTARDYFFFGKERSFVDIIGHQGNDFQITDAFWNELNALTEEFNEDGVFLALPGYEWSGNTGLGGDHNIWYKSEGRPIFRSSRAIVTDKTHPETDCHDVTDLFSAIKDEDVLIVPHVGGRFADVTYAHDAKLEPSVEVHSSWGTFDWILRDALEMGYRVGIVAGSDGHKGRPGASYPGDAVFGSYGGLTCHLMPELTRDCLFDAFRRRHHYATTGCRMYLSVEMDYPANAWILDRNDDAASAQASQTAIMGDIVRTEARTATFRVDASAPAAIEKAEIFDGLSLIETLRTYDQEDLGQRIRITCRGQETRGRQRMVKWMAKAELHGAKIARISAVNFLNPDSQPQMVHEQLVEWTSVTTGGAQSIDLWLADVTPDARVSVETDHGCIEVPLKDVGIDETVVECGGLDKALAVQSLPEVMTQSSLSYSREIPIAETGDTAIYIRLTLEDGHVAWSSPIYSFH